MGYRGKGGGFYLGIGFEVYLEDYRGLEVILSSLKVGNVFNKVWGSEA